MGMNGILRVPKVRDKNTGEIVEKLEGSARADKTVAFSQLDKGIYANPEIVTFAGSNRVSGDLIKRKPGKKRHITISGTIRVLTSKATKSPVNKSFQAGTILSHDVADQYL